MVCPPIADAADILALARTSERTMTVLEAARSLNLPQWWIGAGFVRNPVWDANFGVESDASSDDIDLVYFDPSQISESVEKEHDDELRTIVDAPWSAKNQARMHQARGNDFAPFTSTEDGMAHWVETTAPLALRMESDGGLVLLAVYGIGDLLAGILRPTPYFRSERLPRFHARVSQKHWLSRWPQLRVELGPPSSDAWGSRLLVRG